MSKTEQLARLLAYEKAQLTQILADTNEELRKLPDKQCSIAIKKIKGKLYYYLQWREDGKNHWKYLAPVTPGAAYQTEADMLRLQELTKKKDETERALLLLEEMESLVKKERKKEKLVEDYTFEVFWKDEITARVSVQGSRVKVSKFIEHPLKQLFADTCMSRHQLHRIFEMRCWDRNRADIAQILHQLGLTHYNPYEIVKKTHGVSYNDFIWFRFPGENLTSRDVLVR